MFGELKTSVLPWKIFVRRKRILIRYFAIVVAAVLLAIGGLLVNSIPVIIGSMCIALFLGPSRAVCIGGAYQK